MRYLWLGLGAVACAAAPAPPPSPPTSTPSPSQEAARWVASLTPDTILRYRLRWWYETSEGRVAGQGTATTIPPDSLRFDYRAPLGRRGAVVVNGDAVVWAHPESTARRLVGVVPLFWAAIGVPRGAGAVRAVPMGGGAAWEFTRGDSTVTYTWQDAERTRRLSARVLARGRLLGTSFVELDHATGLPIVGRMLLRAGHAVLVRFAFDAVDTLSRVDAAEWRPAER